MGAIENIKILIADDESRMRKLLKDYLIAKEFVVLEANDGENAVDVFFSQKNIDLIILDVMMPKLDGWEVCRHIRKYSDVPIMMVTAKCEERDELLGFNLGVDEYIAKPFSPKILVARVEALLKRKKSKLVDIDGLKLDKAGRKIQVGHKSIDLSTKEFELLVFFIQNKGISLSRDTILNNVWNYDYFGDIRTVDTHVKKLRSKLQEKGHYIKTIWGLGYKFEVDK